MVRAAAKKEVEDRRVEAEGEALALSLAAIDTNAVVEDEVRGSDGHDGDDDDGGDDDGGHDDEEQDILAGDTCAPSEGEREGEGEGGADDEDRHEEAAGVLPPPSDEQDEDEIDLT